MNKEKNYLSVRQFAEKLNMKRDDVYRKLASGEIEGVKIKKNILDDNNTVWRIRHEEVGRLKIFYEQKRVEMEDLEKKGWVTKGELCKMLNLSRDTVRKLVGKSMVDRKEAERLVKKYGKRLIYDREKLSQYYGLDEFQEMLKVNRHKMIDIFKREGVRFYYFIENKKAKLILKADVKEIENDFKAYNQIKTKIENRWYGKQTK